MNTVYLDCASGVSGDMMLGALVDAGVDLSAIQAAISSLGLPDCQLLASTVKRCGFRATKFTVQTPPEHAHRHLHHIVKMIDQSQLTERQKDLARRIFQRLAEAEAKVHGTTIEKVHFHEVGAADSIADIVGSAVGWDLLGAQQLICSPIPTGSGTIEIAHGRCSVPAPATAELLCGVPLADSPVAMELTTPTGAALVTTLADSFGPLPAMTIRRIGYGAGDRDPKEQPNVLRLYLGEMGSSGAATDVVEVLEASIDDSSPEMIGYCVERLWGAGAVEVYTSSIQMKKQRPAVLLTVLARPADSQRLAEIILLHSSTLGIRHWTCQRWTLERRSVDMPTRWGSISGIEAVLPGGGTRFAPEYEACRKVAGEHDEPIWRVMEEAKRVYLERQGALGVSGEAS